MPLLGDLRKRGALVALVVLVALSLPASAYASNMEPGSGAPTCWAGQNYGAVIWWPNRWRFCTYYGWSPPLHIP